MSGRPAPRVGDVISIRGRDLWLERVNRLQEGDVTIAAVFEARDGWLWHDFDAEAASELLSPVTIAGLAALPLACELEGRVFERRARRPVVIGGGGSLPGGDALLAHYRAGDRVLRVVVASGRVHAWRAEPVLELDVERY